MRRIFADKTNTQREKETKGAIERTSIRDNPLDPR
jgi:hypothetical protein